MSFVVIVVPLLLLIASSIYWNNRQGNLYNTKVFTIITVFDVISSYSFVMIFLSRITTISVIPLVWFALAFCISVVVQLSLYEKWLESLGDAITTFKENITVIFILFIPFLCYMYLFRSINIQLLVIILSVLASVATFIGFILLRMVIPEFLEKIKKGYTVGLISYISAIVVVIIFSIFTFTSTTIDLPIDGKVDVDRYISNDRLMERPNGSDFSTDVNLSTVEIVEIKPIMDVNDIESIVMIIREEDNEEYLLIPSGFYNNTSPNEDLMIYLGVNDEPVSISNTRIVGNGPLFVTSSDKLIKVNIYGGTEVVDGTLGWSTHYIDYNSSAYLAHKDEEYKIINRFGETLEILDENELTVINDHMFRIKDGKYELLSDSSVNFDIVEDSVPYYLENEDKFYQIEYKSRITIVTVDDNSRYEYTFRNPKQEKIIPFAQFNFYNYRQFAFYKRSINLTDDLHIIHIDSPTDSIDRFVRHSDSVHVEAHSIWNLLSFDIDDRGNLNDLPAMYDLGISETDLEESTQLGMLRYLGFVCIFGVLPIISFEAPVTVVSFERLTFKKNKKAE